MATKEELQKQIDWLKGQVSALWLNTSSTGSYNVCIGEPKKWERWKPGDMGDYYIIKSNGVTDPEVWRDHGFDESCYAIGNIYKTEQEAEAVVQNRKVHMRLVELAEGFKPDWGDDKQVKWFLFWNSEDGWGWHYSITSCLPSVVYFKETIDNIQEIIDGEFGKEALKWYLTGSVI